MSSMLEMTALSDEVLVAMAHEWRVRALRGEKVARGPAHELEAEVRRRRGRSPVESTLDDLDTRPLAAREGAARSSWRLW